jgi:hypothetical protein
MREGNLAACPPLAMGEAFCRTLGDAAEKRLNAMIMSQGRQPQWILIKRKMSIPRDNLMVLMASMVGLAAVGVGLYVVADKIGRQSPKNSVYPSPPGAQPAQKYSHDTAHAIGPY